MHGNVASENAARRAGPGTSLSPGDWTHSSLEVADGTCSPPDDGVA